MLRLVLLAALVVAGTLPAAAHVGHGSAFSVLDGFVHPFAGLDHLAAMVAVGIWAASAGGPRVWAWPAVFVVVMAAGAAAGHAGFLLPYIEPVIAGSVVVFGLLTLALVRAPALAGGILVAFFALFHGLAHGAEAPAGSFAGYVAGFVAATAILHAVGIAIVRMSDRSATRLPVRALGGATAALGLGLFVG